ncbi:LCP family protein [Lentzea jiangxiensis]|uniref:Cell envelope-related function transcriptional attenuator common domain-containing protein n=1 Tax=Lentzea jiangxiensis TaxID=641025 RepID=A0A1H0FEY9_9PSEU|nr:LCP family protein [Lentzea jiangxiensis]SDN93132.1 cell envelope-related function transcriptional attenuator common domain-containing protein [Lentzea jiangxiensis]
MNDLIRQAIAAEAEERVDSRTVLAGLHKAEKRKPFGLIVGVATLTAAAAVAAVVVPATIKKTDASPAAPPAASQNVLLIGTDDSEFTDALVLARFDADGSVSAVSLPRDLQVGEEKINRLYGQAPEKLTGAVEQLTGVEVDHYAAVDMGGFGRIAQIVGGVEVCLLAATEDERSGASFPAGRQTVEGDRALAFLRQRMGLPHGDLDRVKRHQAFLTGLAAKINKDNAVALAAEVGRSVRVDEGWDVLAFAQRFQGPVEIVTGTLPVGAPVDGPAGQALQADPGASRQFVADWFGGKATPQDGCVR